ncbi:MAG: restriction endonuclease subunit S [Alphaproteobacteria bacterium]
MTNSSEATEQLSNIPSGWARVTLGDVAEYINGFAFKPSDWEESGLPIIRIQNLTDEDKEFNRSKREVEERYRITNGDLLVSWSATLDAFVWTRGEALLNQHIFKVVPHTELDKRFVFYLLKKSIEELKKSEHMHGSTMRHINRGPFLAHPAYLPPVAEQSRFADRLDELFSQIEKGEENLKRVQTLVKRYRQSVLKAAVTGELTRDWREANGDEGESGEELLARILEARRAAWEAAELEKMKAKGKEPKNDKWKEKYKEPVAADLTLPLMIPATWAVASTESVMRHITSGSRAWKPYYDRGTGVFVMAQNVRPGRFDMSFRQLVDPPLDDPERSRTEIKIDDILVTIVGANTGDVCRVVDEVEEHYVCQSVALLRPVEPALARFLETYFVASEGGQRQYARHIYGAGRPHLSFDQLKQTPVPLPPMAEQQEIILRVDALLSELDVLEKQLVESSRYSDRLRQSVLQAAFSGNLVPQDPNDEPASALLKSISEQKIKYTVAS